MSWCDEHGTDGGCSECSDLYWREELQKVELQRDYLKNLLWERTGIPMDVILEKMRSIL